LFRRKNTGFLSTQNLAEELFKWCVIILLGVSIVALPGFTNVGKTAFSLLSLLAIYYVARNYQKLPKLTKDEKIFFILLGLGFVWTLVTLYVNGSPGNGNNQVWSRQFFLLMLIPLYYLFLSTKLSDYLILLVLILSAIVTCGVALYDVYFDLALGGRATGGTNPILFGSLALCLAGCAVAFVIYNKKSPVNRLLGLLSIVFLFVAVVLSGSRGVWLAIPLLLIMGFGYGFPRLNYKTKTVLVILCLVAISMSYFIPIVEKRVDATVSNIQSYAESDSLNDEVRGTNLGTRLEMWKAGVKMFVESPVFGVGMGGYLETARQNLDKYEVNESALKFYHPHNQFVSALATRGIFGLFFVLSVMIYPIFLLLRVKKRYDVNNCYVFVGLFVALSYLVYSITDVPLEGKPLIIFYAIIMALVLANVRRTMSPNPNKDAIE
jgi:O-antigen ligase